jgi:predicted  nucleic acid-binding Zn-ribbon protein
MPTDVTIDGMRVSEALRQMVLAERDELRAENRLLRLRGDTYLEQLQQKHAENERLRAAIVELQQDVERLQQQRAEQILKIERLRAIEQAASNCP